MSTASKSAASVTFTSDRTMRVERIFNAARDRVWRAMTEANLIAQWYCRGNPVDIEQLELEVGGHWRFVEQTLEGPHGFEGRYRVVEPPRVLEYTFEWDGAPGHVVVERNELEDLDDGRTRLIATSLFATAEDMAGMSESGMESGMNQSYAALDRLLASLN